MERSFLALPVYLAGILRVAPLEGSVAVCRPELSDWGEGAPDSKWDLPGLPQAPHPKQHPYMPEMEEHYLEF